MVKVIDLRNKVMGGNDQRSTITKIARHHSATDSGDVFKFESYWKGKGWNTGGYHEVILRNGDVQLCYDENVITNGIYGHNSNTYHICLVGNGDFTDEQEEAFAERFKYNAERLELSVDDLLGHNEFSGANTACPGIDMNEVRAKLKQADSSTNGADLTVDGYWGTKTTTALQKSLDTVVDGVISGQVHNQATDSVVSGITFGGGGSLVIETLQRKIGSTDDGLLGPNTVSTLQEYLGTVVDGVISDPSLVVKALQRALNAGNL
ncbi:NlpC/P60 domain-containing protein [Gracilibacillus halophilus YIM-C55.5]|uniref:Autolysin n=2 Tax=Gracilibacillus TaxID=74385 RepID=N4WQK0_9BACI|nr:NlpC/P60 domain-containing protein [Gracilibacillus halophilus YIM-C55.5]